MRTLAIIGFVVALSGFAASPVFPLSYEMDAGQDGTFETGEYIDIPICDLSVTIDLYIDGYVCPPDDKLFGVQTYIHLGPGNYFSIDSCHPFDTSHGGPFDSSLSECLEMDDYEQVYALIVGDFSFVTVIDGRQKIGTVQATAGGLGESPLVIADDLSDYGLYEYTDGGLSDCNYSTLHPAEATVWLRHYSFFCFADIIPDQASVNAQATRQFDAEAVYCCSSPSYLWSDNCAYGNVDQEGLFTANATCVGEICQVMAVDTVNTGMGEDPAWGYAEVEIIPLIPCYADCNDDKKVDLSDLVIMRGEFSRTDCAINPCQADCNGDDKVDLADLVIMKEQFMRTGCPECM